MVVMRWSRLCMWRSEERCRVNRPSGPNNAELVLVVGSFVGVALVLLWREASGSAGTRPSVLGVIAGLTIVLGVWWRWRIRTGRHVGERPAIGSEQRDSGLLFAKSATVGSRSHWRC